MAADTDADVQTFLHVMADIRKLAASDPAKKMAAKLQELRHEIQELRERDQESHTVINRLTQDMVSLRERAEAVGSQNETLLNTTKGLRDALSNAKKDCADINLVAEQRALRLNEKCREVEQLKRNMVNLNVASTEDVGEQWSQLWGEVNQLATDFFSDDLAQETLQATHSWAPSTRARYEKEFPCPANNSSVAKQMRIVAVTAIVASALTLHIFRPVGMDKALADATSELARTDPEKESFYRSSHLAVLESLQNYKLSVTNRAVTSAFSKIHDSVAWMLSEERSKEFRDRLDGVCRLANAKWQVFQTYRERYEVEMEGDRDYEPVSLWQPPRGDARGANGVNGAATAPAPLNGQKREHKKSAEEKPAVVVTPVWPLIKVVGLEGEDTRISGLALFSDQTRAAEEQIRRARRVSSREEGKQEEKKNGSSKPLSIGKFLPSSPKST